jgi:hypothetical protein
MIERGCATCWTRHGRLWLAAGRTASELALGCRFTNDLDAFHERQSKRPVLS